MANILVIDDDRAVRQFLSHVLCGPDTTVVAAASAAEGRAAMAVQLPDLVLLDILLPDGSGMDLFDEIRRIGPDVPVAIITACTASDTAIRAMRCGASDYLVKPLDAAHVRQVVRQVLESQSAAVVAIDDADRREESLIGRCPQMLDVYKAIGQVAASDVAVMIRGESGTGKELVARALHRHGSRRRGPILAVNCAAIPESLLESELFGHEKGSFTGADRRRIGKFEQCSGGTIFLDEVGDIPPSMQAKLLRVLQEQRFERVGGNATIRTNVRIIAATHCNLERMSREGHFRPDLYWRLNGFSIALPPLRERGNDLVLLLQHFLLLAGRQIGRKAVGFAPDALQCLVSYRWPGNIRELQCTVRLALLQTAGPVVTVEALPHEIREARREPARPSVADHSFDAQIERLMQRETTDLYEEARALLDAVLLGRVMHFTSGNQSQAARILGLSRGSVRTMLDHAGLLDRRNGRHGARRRAAGRPAALLAR